MELNSLSVHDLIMKRNAIEGIIFDKKSKKINKNIGRLKEEILNLLDGVGKGFVAADYYAENRFYSKIPGVKNIRIDEYDNNHRIFVKVVSPSGYQLPKTIKVRNIIYKIKFYKSKNYNKAIDY